MKTKLQQWQEARAAVRQLNDTISKVEAILKPGIEDLGIEDLFAQMFGTKKEGK